MKIRIQEERAVSGSGAIFFWFWCGHTINLIAISPSCRPGYSWCVDHPGHTVEYSYFHSFKQARQFALTAAVLFAHGRPIPVQ